MSELTEKICVVHLVRAHNGIEPFKCFLESYLENPSGIKHDLLVIFKGFERSSDKEPYVTLLAPIQYLSLDVTDIGFDINAYFAVANYYAGQYKYFCFLNSFSTILCRDWLSKLYENISRSGVGLVGASGSWQSINRWGRILERRGMQFSGSSLSNGNKRNRWELAKYMIVAIWRLFTFPIFFHPFPNYHLRTNAFMLSSDLMIKIDLPTIKTKIDAYRFESGKNGLTRQILAMGFEVLVVGKDGVGYKSKLWNKSKTFWQSNQENLLVADNQTRSYQNGSHEERKYLKSMAWGKESNNFFGTSV